MLVEKKFFFKRTNDLGNQLEVCFSMFQQNALVFIRDDETARLM